MANVHVFKQNYRSQYGAMSTSLGGESSDVIETPVYVDAANYDLIRAVAQVSNVVATHTVTLQMMEATTSAGAGSQAITVATDTYLSTQVTDVDVLEAQVRGEGLSSGFQFVGATLTTDDPDGTEAASVSLVQGRARYKQAAMPT